MTQKAFWLLGVARVPNAELLSGQWPVVHNANTPTTFGRNDMNAKGAFARAMLLSALGLILLVSVPLEARRTPCPGPDVVGLWHMNENEGS